MKPGILQGGTSMAQDDDDDDGEPLHGTQPLDAYRAII